MQVSEWGRVGTRARSRDRRGIKMRLTETGRDVKDEPMKRRRGRSICSFVLS